MSGFRQYLPMATVVALLIGAVYALSNIFRIGWEWDVIAIDFCFGFVLTIFIWMYNVWVYPRIVNRLGWERRPYLLRFVQVLSTLLLALLIVQAGDGLQVFKPEWVGYKLPEMAEEMKGMLTALIVLLVVALFETGDKFYKTQLENERLKLANSIAQFEMLKQQINPHFLFNSLNILKTLIANKEEKAETYLIRLSEFYRNILLLNKNDRVSLAEELDTLANYLYLVNVRFEGKFSCFPNVSASARQSSIPPFTLQLLLENAIKHNVASHEHPLVVSIFEENGFLVVRNPLQPKRSVEPGGHVGLENIIKRYRLLSNQEVEIEKTATEFIVRLPLIH